MDTFWSVLVLIGAALLIWFNIWIHQSDEAAQRRAAVRAEHERQRQALVCPHCHAAGQVDPVLVRNKQGISGGKATGAVLTGGVSLLLTGLARKQTMTQMHCGNCGMTWDVA